MVINTKILYKWQLTGYNLYMEHKSNRLNIISPIVTTIGLLAPMHEGEIYPGGPHRIVDWHSSFYPIPAGEGKWILIDGGMDKQARRFERFMDERDLNETDILAGFITHAHSDHVGAFHKFDNFPVYVGQGDVEVILGNKPSQGQIPRLLDYRPGYLGAMIPELKPKIISDDQVIEIGNLTIRGIAMKGHTDGSMGYLIGNRDNGEYIFHGGDAFDHNRRGRVRLPPRSVSADRRQGKINRGRHIVNATRRIIDLGIRPRIVVSSHSGHGDFRALEEFTNLTSSSNLVK